MQYTQTQCHKDGETIKKRTSECDSDGDEMVMAAKRQRKAAAANTSVKFPPHLIAQLPDELLMFIFEIAAHNMHQANLIARVSKKYCNMITMGNNNNSASICDSLRERIAAKHALAKWPWAVKHVYLLYAKANAGVMDFIPKYHKRDKEFRQGNYFEHIEEFEANHNQYYSTYKKLMQAPAPTIPMLMQCLADVLQDQQNNLVVENHEADNNKQQMQQQQVKTADAEATIQNQYPFDISKASTMKQAPILNGWYGYCKDKTHESRIDSMDLFWQLVKRGGGNAEITRRIILTEYFDFIQPLEGCYRHVEGQYYSAFREAGMPRYDDSGQDEVAQYVFLKFVVNEHYFAYNLMSTYC